MITGVLMEMKELIMRCDYDRLRDKILLLFNKMVITNYTLHRISGGFPIIE